MATQGGYRQPAEPAAVSGPGALSQRTDGGPGASQPASRLPDAKYGEQQAFQELQAAAPIAAAPGTPAPPAPAEAGPEAVPFSAPTSRPDEPVTAGADAGPGAGQDALGLHRFDPENPALDDLRQTLPALEILATAPFASESLRQYVRYVRSLL